MPPCQRPRAPWFIDISAIAEYVGCIKTGEDLPVASITIRSLDEGLKARLRVRAAHHGRSMEEEVRDILRRVLTEAATGPDNLADSIRRRFTAVGGVDLPLAPREPMREPPELGG